MFSVHADAAPETPRLVDWGGLDEATRLRFATMGHGESLHATLARTRQPLIVEDLERGGDPLARALKADGIGACAGFPLLDGDHLLGTVAFVTRRRSQFGVAALELIRVVGDLVAAALARERMQAELARSAESLRESEARYRAVFENAGIGLLQFQIDHHVEVNDALCRMLGYSPQEFAAMHWLDYTHPDHRADNLARVEALQRGEIDAFSLEKRYLHKDGHTVWARIDVSLIRDGEGRPRYQIVMIQDITERRLAEDALRASMEAAQVAARTDSLTGLPNRLAFNEALARPARAGERGVLFLDVNDFKRINDSLGHESGDAIIRILAERLRRLGGSDAFLARVGGDEFVFVVTGPDAATRLAALGRQVRDAAREPISVPGGQVGVRIAMGLAVQREDGLPGETLVRQADLAMYHAKRTRQPGPVPFTALIEDAAHEAARIEAALRHALRTPEAVTLAYQPIVGLDGRWLQAEALARWTSPELGPVPPDSFVRVAERAGLMIDLGRSILRRVCDDLERHPRLRVSLNVSAVQLMAVDFVSALGASLAERGLAPDRIELELTETLLVSDPALAAERIGELRRAGFRVTLDDFGAGFSSLGYLQRMRFDRLKIDRSLVTGSHASRRRSRLLRSVIDMAHALDLPVVCEGVETFEDLQALALVGCDFAQGFHIGRPGPVEGLMERWA